MVSLVGYTNVGKSSLMNALCGPSVAEADMLFATPGPHQPQTRSCPAGWRCCWWIPLVLSPGCPITWWKLFRSNPGGGCLVGCDRPGGGCLR